MRIVGLISGGKDSMYNLMQCVQNGHEIVALANICPENETDHELNSHMYQTVGHEGVLSIAKAMELPLFQKSTTGNVTCSSLQYECTNIDQDEVEDLTCLLFEMKKHVDFDGVSVGAIESNYQRSRVENVCGRLKLKCFAYLWQRNQSELLKEMLDNNMKIVIVKVASLGLKPAELLGKEITPETLTYFDSLKTSFGFNVCGEGGEYETFTLHCPLYKRTIVLKNYSVQEDCDDPSVGHIVLESLELCPKMESEEFASKSGHYMVIRLLGQCFMSDSLSYAHGQTIFRADAEKSLNTTCLERVENWSETWSHAHQSQPILSMTSLEKDAVAILKCIFLKSGDLMGSEDDIISILEEIWG